MDLMILNTNLDAVYILDSYESFIWVDRYWENGDFELYTAMRDGILDHIRQDYYIQRRDSDRAMIIEHLLINSDAEVGNHITVTGRSLESILTRRVVWGQKRIKGNLQEGIRTLLNECIISPSNPNRQIPNFIFKESTDPAITSLTMDRQFTGDNLYDIIQGICSEKSIGFKITINDYKQFVFELYAGVDRSYDQTSVPYVVFSPNFDNIINTNYVESRSSLKNVALVGGEGEGSARKYHAVGDISGLDRREIFVDARDISKDDGDGGEISSDEYTELLIERGKEKLAENIDVVSFDGQVETTIMFKYGEDFFDGDIVQIANEYGHETKARIVEIIISENEEGFSVYPTFKTVTEGGE